MKSKVCHLISSHSPIDQILAEAEKTAAYAGLEKQDALQLRLLAEEMTGILKGIAGDFSADFQIEESNRKFQLRLTAAVRLNREKKDRLIAVSSSGKNNAYHGVMGKIGQIFEAYMDHYDEVSAYCKENGINLSQSDMLMGGSSLQPDGLVTWSLNRYKDTVKDRQLNERWDELEQSIVASIADDITVSIRNDKAEIIITKRFH